MTALSILVVGLLLGMKHATEADHLAAVAALAARQTSLTQALRQGLAWGVGHTLTLMLFGGAVFALGQAISPGLGQALETAVGLMLVVLGADVLRGLIRDRLRLRVQRPDAEGAHAHPQRWPLRALAVGMMHGLAGSAALVMLSLQGLPSVALGMGYVAVFGLGSIVGMGMLSVVIAMPLKLSAQYLLGLHRAMRALVGICSIGLGVSIVVEIGYLKAQLFA